MKRGGPLGKSIGGVAGFTLVELMTVMLLIGIMVGMAVPVYLDSTRLVEKNTCKYNQRAMESAIQQWGMNHINEQFVTENCLPGDGEAYLDLEGNIPGEPERSLAPLMKRGFDCHSNGQGVGQIGDCDYITDGYSVACLTDNQIGVKLDGTPFKHDRPVDVEWNHFRGTAGAEAEAEPLTPLGSSFEEITDGMIALIQAFYEEHGRYPRSKGDSAFTDIGLDPDFWKNAVNHIHYTPAGKRVNVKPEKGYAFRFIDSRGKERVLSASKKESLLYDMKSGEWYYKNTNKKNKIDISTLEVYEE